MKIPVRKQLAIGHVVYLRSGSPKMTVIRTNYSPRKSEVTVQWIAYGTTELRTATFPHDAVRRTYEYRNPGEPRPIPRALEDEVTFDDEF